jgi:hypothetical protein
MEGLEAYFIHLMSQPPACNTSYLKYFLETGEFKGDKSE